MPALLAAVGWDDAPARDLRAILARAICGVLAAVVAFCDPEIVVIGGTWGPEPVVLDAIAAEFEPAPGARTPTTLLRPFASVASVFVAVRDVAASGAGVLACDELDSVMCACGDAFVEGVQEWSPG